MAVIQRLNQLLAKLKRRQAQARRDNDASVIVGYSQNYAVRVHEDLEVFHANGQAKFLEEPFREMRPELVKVVRNGMRRGLTMEQALLIAGLRLQRESQLFVPVDTGALRASAFTRKE